MHLAQVMMEERPTQMWRDVRRPEPIVDNVVPLRGGAGKPAPESGDGQFLRGIRLHLLGAFQISVGGRLLPLGTSIQRLLAILALQPHPINRSTVAGLLWDDSAERRAQANLRTTVYRLNQICNGIIEATTKTLRISPMVAVDAREVGVFANQLLDDAPGLHLGWPPMGALNHDLLPDWDHEWLRPEQERFRSLRLHCLETLCERLVRDGRYGQAADAALTVVHADPFRESAHGQLIKVYLAEGNRHEAVRHFLQYRRNLDAELGMSPSREISRLLDVA
jgi:DNA-binding SARP family transcriptional activator